MNESETSGAAPEDGTAEAPPPPVPPARDPPPVGAATIADGSLRQLDRAFITADALSWWILVGVIGAGGAVGLVIMLLAAGKTWSIIIACAWLFLLGLAILGALRWPRLAWRHASYIVHSRGIEIRRGVVWRRVISVPTSRVQHTDVIQGPLLRRYGLATLTIHTAGTQAAVVTLEGLRRDDALRIRDALLGATGRDGV